MFGRPEAAAAAETMFNCSGSQELYAKITPFLDVLGTSRWIGPEPEQAMMVKIIGNNMIHAAVEQCAPGDVLLVTTTSPCRDGLLGELLATSLRRRGVRGAVLTTGVRDVAELRELPFPVWSAMIAR